MYRRTSISLLIIHFFGLTTEYRISLFKTIHNIVFHGNGGYDWDTVYNMPIWLRNFTFSEIKNYHDEINKQGQNEKSWVNKNSEEAKAAKSINIPEHIRNPQKPYQTKASRK